MRCVCYSQDWLSLGTLQKPGAGPKLCLLTWEKPGTEQLKLHHNSCFTAPLILLMCTQDMFHKKKELCFVVNTFNVIFPDRTGDGIYLSTLFSERPLFFSFSGNGRKQNILYPWCVAIHQAESSGISQCCVPYH